MTEIFEVSHQDLIATLHDIAVANGVVTRMEVKPASYVLTVRWPEKKTK